MPTTIEEIEESAIHLPVEQRARLAERLLASLEDADNERIWTGEAIRRREEIRSGQVQPIPSEEVHDRIDRLLRK